MSAGRRSGREGPRDAEMEAQLGDLLAMMAEIAVAGAEEPADALEGEEWASGLVGTWRIGSIPDPAIDELFWPGLVVELERLGGTGGLATLRALGSIGEEPHAGLAVNAADRLAAAGVGELSWAVGLGAARPLAAMLMCDDGFDDGVSVMVEFAMPGVATHTLGVYIDHNMGGLVKDAFVAGPLAGVCKELRRRAPKGEAVVLREIELAEARARVEDALYMLDHTVDPPVDDDVRSLRALMYARMRALPGGGTGAADLEQVTPEERERLLGDFLASPHGQRWRGDEDAEDVAGMAIDFGADYNHGGPLRWSPVVVEIFMTGWLARKVVREAGFFERVPDVLRDWVAFAGQRRAVASAAVGHAVAAVDRHRDEMLETVGDAAAWGPAKAFAAAAQEAGVDLSDPAAIGEFIERYNGGLAA